MLGPLDKTAMNILRAYVVQGLAPETEARAVTPQWTLDDLVIQAAYSLRDAAALLAAAQVLASQGQSMNGRNVDSFGHRMKARKVAQRRAFA